MGAAMRFCSTLNLYTHEDERRKHEGCKNKSSLRLKLYNELMGMR